MSLPLLLSLLLVLSLSLTHATPCQPTFSLPSFSASFDLTRLMRSGDYLYKVSDTRNETNYQYLFNVCGQIDVDLPTCATQLANKGVSTVPAVQLDESQSTCKLLSQSLDEPYVQARLIDTNDPTKGISLQYTGGDKCSRGTNRSLLMNFVCTEEETKLSSTVDEEDYCSYAVHFFSAYGCPRECAWGANGEICGGNGFCALDASIAQPRCFCRDGFYGEDCLQTNIYISSCNNTCVLLIFAVILLTVLLLLGSLFLWRLSRVAYGYSNLLAGKNSSDALNMSDIALQQRQPNSIDQHEHDAHDL